MRFWFLGTQYTLVSPVSSGYPPSDLKATNLDHSKSRSLSSRQKELSAGSEVYHFYLTMTTTKTPPLPQSMGGGPSFQMDPKEFEKLQALPGNLNCSEWDFGNAVSCFVSLGCRPISHHLFALVTYGLLFLDSWLWCLEAWLGIAQAGHFVLLRVFRTAQVSG